MSGRWIPGPLPEEVERALGRLTRSEGVEEVAVMPDVHLAHEVCVGVVTATTSALIPSAVGGDIGCGMAAVAFDRPASAIEDPEVAARLLRALYDRVPVLRHKKEGRRALPEALAEAPLSAPALETAKRRLGPLQLGTIGRGNHFLELQRDEGGALWAMVHSGSRGIGPRIRDHHLARAQGEAEADPGAGLPFLRAESEAGQAYLSDVRWARAYARANREAILGQLTEALGELLGASPIAGSLIERDHNHVAPEARRGRSLFVHRKGAQRAEAGEAVIIPGSMGSESFHAEGRGCEAALCSCSHGAGRAMSRSEARRKISLSRLHKETRGIFFDRRLSDRLREEAPGAYKEIGAVMRAQRELVRITRRLSPLLVFKGA